MAVLSSAISPRSDTYRTNTAAMATAIGSIQDAAQSIMQGGNHKAREKHLSRVKILPRERVDQLIDPGSPFLEI